MQRAAGAADMARVMALRAARFGVGADAFDAGAMQIMVLGEGGLQASFRLTSFANGADMAASYSGQFYDLTGFSGLKAPALEMGRFCLAARAAGREADVLRLCFAAITAEVDRLGAALLFGCASYQGSDPEPHLSSLAGLKPHVAGPWPVGRKAPHVIDLAPLSPPADAMAALRATPPLLRSYVGIGGWVSDHAVQDFDLGTIHIFTGVEVAHIPPARATALRALAGQIDLG